LIFSSALETFLGTNNSKTLPEEVIANPPLTDRFGLIFAMGVIAASNSIGVQLSVSYCIDSYKDLSGEAMVTVIIIRNTMSFAIGYGVTPWVTNMGYQNAFILAAFAGLAQVLTFLAVVKWGKSWRTATKNRYYKFVKESEHIGISH